MRTPNLVSDGLKICEWLTVSVTSLSGNKAQPLAKGSMFSSSYFSALGYDSYWIHYCKMVGRLECLMCACVCLKHVERCFKESLHFQKECILVPVHAGQIMWERGMTFMRCFLTCPKHQGLACNHLHLIISVCFGSGMFLTPLSYNLFLPFPFCHVFDSFNLVCFFLISSKYDLKQIRVNHLLVS